jgi:hypothetical protein
MKKRLKVLLFFFFILTIFIKVNASKNIKAVFSDDFIAVVHSEFCEETFCTPIASIFTVNACGSYTWVANNNKVYTASNYIDSIVFVNALGCDSIVRLNLTINKAPTIDSISSLSICAGNLVTLNLSNDAKQIIWQLNGNTVKSTTNLTTSSRAISTAAGGNGSGSAANQFRLPQGIFVDTSDNVYIADWGNGRIQKWAPGASTGNTSIDQLGSPSSVFLDASGNIYFAEEINHRIQKLIPGATYGVTVAGGNGYGTAANQLALPTAVVLNGKGNIYVSERDNHRIQKWAPGYKLTSYTPTTGGNLVAIVSNLSGCSDTSNVITVKQPTTSTFTVVACGSYTWAANNNKVYTKSNHQDSIILVNSIGCDSIVRLNLKISDTKMTYFTINVCGSYIWVANGNKLYTTNNNSDSIKLVSADGCDSIVKLNLTVLFKPSKPTIFTSLANLQIPATGVPFSCNAVSGAFNYWWSYSGTGAMIVGNNSQFVFVDFAANATNGFMKVDAITSQGCVSSDSVMVNVLLPIILNNFTVNKLIDAVRLNWQSKIEINAKEYQIEKSTNARDFNQLSIIAARCKSSDYVFTDNTFVSRVNYYRLKLVDNDGKFGYSEVKQIVSDKSQYTFIMYPNPAKSVVSLQVDKLIGSGKLLIVDYLGKVVKEQPLSMGTNTVDIANLSKGMYFVSTITNEGKTTKKLIVE